MRIRAARKRSIAIPIGFLAALAAMSLSGCDADPDKQGAEAKSGSESLVQQGADARTNSTRPGPHGSHDPHARLTPDKHAQVALQHLAEGRPALALDALNQAIERYPDSAMLYGVRGSLYLEQERSAAALADLNEAVQLAPHNPVFLTNRAQAYRRFGRTEEAMADLDSAIELDSGFVAARFNRGSLAFNAGRYEQALADFDACIAADPQSAAPYFNRASVHDAMGNRALAIDDLERFLQMAPSEEWKAVATELLAQWNAAEAAAEAKQAPGPS